MKMILLWALMAVSAVSLVAQGQGAAEAADKAKEKQAARREAFVAFKDGAAELGLGRLKASLDKSADAPAEELQLTGDLAGVAYWLANERHPHAANAAFAAVEQVGNVRGKGKMAVADEAHLLALAGMLQEQVIGDAVQAREAYEAALALDAKQPEAKNGLARIQRVDALIAEKARENEALRKREAAPRS